MVLHVGYQIASACAPGVPHAAVMHSTIRAFNRVRAGTRGWPPAQGHPRVGHQPWLDGLGLIELIVIDHHLEPCIRLRWIAPSEDVAHVAEQRGGFPWPQRVVQRPSGGVASASHVRRLALAQCHDLARGPGGHPGAADFGQPVDIPGVSEHHGRTPFEVLEDLADAGHALDTVGIVIVGHEVWRAARPSRCRGASAAWSRPRSRPLAWSAASGPVWRNSSLCGPTQALGGWL